MPGLRVRGGLEGTTGARGRTVTTGSRSLMPYDSATSKTEVTEEEKGRSELSFTARLMHPTPSELTWFLLSFCTHPKPAGDLKGVYASSLDKTRAKRTKIVGSIESCTDLRCDSTMDGHLLPAGMTLHQGFERQQGLACARNRSTPGR